MGKNLTAKFFEGFLATMGGNQTAKFSEGFLADANKKLLRLSFWKVAQRLWEKTERLSFLKGS